MKVDTKKLFNELVSNITSPQWWWSWFMIILGCALLAAGYVLFISPYNIVPGGVYGAGIVLHNLFPEIKIGTFGYMFDTVLLALAFISFGPRFGSKTVVAALLTPGLMNLFTRLAYPTEEAMQTLDPSLMLGGILDMSDHLMLTTIVGAVVLGVGVGFVVRQQATTGGTDIVAMMIQKYCHISFSQGVLIADSIVVLAGLLVIGFGIGGGEPQGWQLSFYSLIAIYVSSRILAFMLDGASYDRIIFIITSHHNEEFRRYILEEMDRSGTYIKTSGMYTNEEKEMIFLVVPRRELVKVQRAIKDYDPKAFMVVANAYNTFGEGFKPLPEKHELENM
ncbi:MAG: YitT family protein [Alistipes sp.]|nr:YitT family protein [Alistipes sp.]MBR0340511.1 YitT family protein [Alistipes sp.]